ncbi:unnamed protein product, partial [Schistocephalus solidus]|uniref:Uncharacterized protein n=1 Tax=Schistocephalus solidus TaxID=70667 RepID=A0A183TT72_SCHSO
MVAAITGPYCPPVIPHNPLPDLEQPTQPRVSHADPLLAPVPFVAGHNIRDWLVELSLFLVDLAPADHTRYMLRF